MMKQIKRFKLKDGTTFDTIQQECKFIRDGGSWINPDSLHYISRDVTPQNSRGAEISLEIGFPKDLSKWDDYDFVLVLDEDFCQPYTPFYGNEPFPFLSGVISMYNEVMERFSFLEEIDTEELEDGHVCDETA